MQFRNVKFILFLLIIFLISSGFGQTTTIDFETENSGYSASVLKDQDLQTFLIGVIQIWVETHHTYGHARI